jgi:hypothetical protein
MGAEQHARDRENADALRDIEAFVADLPCLGEPVEQALETRALFLRGYVHAEDGDLDAARTAFRRLAVADPDARWDRDWDERHEPELERARGEVAGLPPASLAVVPPPSGLFVVDGRARTAGAGPLGLPPGAHVVQIVEPGRVLSFEVTLVPGSEATLVVPALARDEHLGWVEDRARQPDLDALLAVVPAALRPAKALWAERTWVRGAEGWAMEEPPPAVDAPDPLLGRILLGGGGALVVGAGAWAGVAYLQAAPRWDELSCEADGLPRETADKCTGIKEHLGRSTLGAGLTAAAGGIGVGLAFALSERGAPRLLPMAGRPGLVVLAPF